MLTTIKNSALGLAAAHILAYIHGLRDGLTHTSTPTTASGLLARYDLAAAHAPATRDIQATLDRGAATANRLRRH